MTVLEKKKLSRFEVYDEMKDRWRERITRCHMIFIFIQYSEDFPPDTLVFAPEHIIKHIMKN